MSAGIMAKIAMEDMDRLTFLRKKIDRVDMQLLSALAERVDIVQEIAEYKKANNIEILQVNRWQDVLQDRTNLGLKLGLNKDFLHEIFTLIHHESIEVQKKLTEDSARIL